jgi:cytochrome P450
MQVAPGDGSARPPHSHDPLEGFDLVAAFEEEIGAQVADPYPVYAELQRQGTVFAGDMLTEHLGFDSSMLSLWGGQPFTVLGYDEVRQVLNNPAHFSSAIYGVGSVKTMGRNIIVMDPPEHHLHRRLVQAAFSKRTTERWNDEIAQPLVDERFSDDFVARGHAELMSEFCITYPISVIHHILGLPRENLAQVHQWAIGLLLYRTHLDIAQVCAERLGALVAQHVELRRSFPGDDIISALCRATLPTGESLTDEEIATFLRVFLNAGSETTTSALGSLFSHLLSEPEQLELVRSNPEYVPRAVEETLRLEPSLGVTWRVCVDDYELGGLTIPGGSPVCVGIAAANRDPRRFEQPARFDITRRAEPHVTFGYGPHVCLGQHVARMEMATALTTFLDRLPKLRLASDARPAGRGVTFRSPVSVPVRWD